jgi:hypothetical protein
VLNSHLVVAAAALVLLTTVRAASADPIGPDCGTCQGAIYELLYQPTPVGSTVDSTIYEITLRIDTTGYDGTGVRIDDVSFKVSANLNGQTLLDAPGGVGNWTALFGGINAGGCQGNAASGFGCATSDSDAVATLLFAGVYEWVFHAFVPIGASLKTEPFDASIKARYVDTNDRKVGDLVSEGITLQVIPEPVTALLLLGGLAGLSGFGRSRRS